MDMTVMDIPQRIETRINSVTDRNLQLKIFSFRLKSREVISFMRLRHIDSTTLKITVDTAGKTQKKNLQLDHAPVLSNSLKYAVLQRPYSGDNLYPELFY
ncbi:MAG: hypothetical protein MZU91_05470 [Desulfosudis oleivorans]|nr:hypothetical protein [Desulfosudis oleivorans]